MDEMRQNKMGWDDEDDGLTFEGGRQRETHAEREGIFQALLRHTFTVAGHSYGRTGQAKTQNTHTALLGPPNQVCSGHALLSWTHHTTSMLLTV